MNDLRFDEPVPVTSIDLKTGERTDSTIALQDIRMGPGWSWTPISLATVTFPC